MSDPEARSRLFSLVFNMSELMRECLDWLDRYLGPVRRSVTESTGG